MFPSTTKEAYSNANGSPKYREGNRSTYLPYFKRFPNQRFLSHQRRKQDEPIPAPARRFFTQEKHQVEQQSTNFGRFQSSTILKEKTPSKLRPKLFRQKYERESNKIKRASEASVEDKHNRMMINSSFQLHQTNYLTPMQAIKNTNNLTDYELHQIISFQEIYYSGQNCPKKLFNGAKPKEGEEGYPWSNGDHIAYRYQLLELLGQGSFGQVFRVIDHKNNRSPIALKMVKNNQKYLAQSKIQIKILKTIKQRDPVSSKNCIEIRDFFQFRGRMCMTFTLLSMNLYELIKSNGYYGLPLDLIRRFVLQILNGIHFLHRNKIIHADLKPQNILLKEMNKSGIKIIDFGSSCYQGETIYTYIQSRYYRAPEVILGMPYDRKIDVWSFGCIIAELHLGYPLFGGEDEHEQMCFIIEVLGMPPKDMLHSSKRWHVFFDSSNILKPHEKRQPPASKSLSTALENPDSDFIDFIKTCLQWHPQRRIQALDLMKHRWVLKDLPPDFRDQHLKYIHDEEQELQHQETTLFKKSRKHTFSIRERHRLIK